MKVSIITVVYNNISTISQAVSSVSGQSYPVEHLVIDGASNDGTKELLESTPEINLVSEPDQGLYDAMNKGLSLASGDIIGILNSDDFYTSDHVLEEVASLFRQTNCDVLYADVNYVERDHPDKLVRKWTSGQFGPDYFEKGYVPAHPTVFIKKELAQEFRYDLKFILAADYDWLLRLFGKPGLKIHYLQKPIINMRLGGATSKNWKNILKGNLEIAQSWWKNKRKIPLWTMLVRRPMIKLKQYQ